MVDPLTRLAITYGTDKFGYHDYTPNYFSLLRHLRDSPVRLLEIGVGGYQDADRGGESLEVWRDFFPKGEIVGIDIQKKEMDLGKRVTILQGSQVDGDFLARVVAEHGPFDIIIDDGSHQNEHVVTSFRLLFPTLSQGGIYVAEDVQTSFFPRFGGSIDLGAPNSVGFFRGMFQKMGKGDGAMGGATGRASEIRRFHNMVAVLKSADLDDTPEPQTALVVGRNTEISAWRAANPSPAVTPLEIKGKAPAKKTLANLMANQAPFDMIVDMSGNPPDEMVPRLFPALKNSGAYVALVGSGDNLDWYATRFVEVDHREIAVNFPEYKAGPLAKEIYSIHRRADQITLIKGANDYPSNFGFEFEHPQARPVFDAMEQVLEREGSERGLLLFTDIMTRAGQEDRAARMLEKLGGMEATSRSYFNMAVRRAKLDQKWDHALDLLKKAVILYPEDYRIRSQLGSIHAKARKWENAVTEFEAGIKFAPRDALLRIQLANALGQMGQHSAAVDAAREAVKIAPSHAGHHTQLGRLEINAGDAQAAIETLKKSADLNGDVANTFRQLSRAYDALGNKEKALGAIDRAIALRPDSAEYRRWQERLTSQ